MVVKGNIRANPAQLARHLLRTDQNERVEILQCDGSPTLKLRDAFSDWQLLTEGTRGSKGLYHAQINPDPRYDLSREQWERAADILEKELGLSGQPRSVVLHQKKGRPHLHVVWARTDIRSMRIISNSHNYRKHERASARMELEFGHEPTPGVHEKRNPEAPRPRAAFNHASWQQFERTRLDPRELIASLTDIYRASDSGRAFRGALEEQGYLIAKGDQRVFVIVDPAGGTHSLSRHIEGATAREIRERFADLDPASLPSVEDARALQQERSPAPNQPIKLPEAAASPGFNTAAARETLKPPPVTPDPDEARQALRAQLETDRERFLAQLRRDAIRQESWWAEQRRHDLERFDVWLRERRSGSQARDENAPLWKRALDRFRESPAEGQSTPLRDSFHAQSERADRLRELAAWEQHQRVTFREGQAEKLAEYDARYVAEIERLEREAERYAALRHESQDRAPTREKPRSATIPEPPRADLGSNTASNPASDTLDPPYLQAASAADQQALIARQQRQMQSAERRWQHATERELAAFERWLAERRAAERARDAREARRGFPYLGPGPEAPAPAPKPPRRARWHFRPARAQQRAEQRLREQQAREVWRDSRDAQDRAAKQAALQANIVNWRTALAEQHLREQAALEERQARLRGERHDRQDRLLREAERYEQLRREREHREQREREQERQRPKGLDRDREPPPRLRALFRRATAPSWLRTAGTSLSSVFLKAARPRRLARLFNRLAARTAPIRRRTPGQSVPGRPASPTVPPRPRPPPL